MTEFKATAPGSMMLMGEHAVLHNQPCLVAALDKRIHITLTPRQDTHITIHSDLGQYQTDLKHLTMVEPPFHFVLGALSHFQDYLSLGCDIDIQAEFQSTIGFGSSAAIIVAMTAVIRQWLGLGTEQADIFQDSLHILHKVQGRGSGADIAASVFGGLLQYTPPTSKNVDQALDNSIKQLQGDIIQCIPLTIIYCGYKTATAKVIDIVETHRQQNPTQFNSIFNAIGQHVHIAAKALEDRNLKQFTSAVKDNQTLMNQLGVNDDTLQDIINALEQDDGIAVAKISGSGLGDCVFGLGTLKTHIDWPKLGSDIQPISATIDKKGVAVQL